MPGKIINRTRERQQIAARQERLWELGRRPGAGPEFDRLDIEIHGTTAHVTAKHRDKVATRMIMPINFSDPAHTIDEHVTLILTGFQAIGTGADIPDIWKRPV